MANTRKCLPAYEMDRMFASVLNVAETKALHTLYAFNGHLKWANINYDIRCVADDGLAILKLVKASIVELSSQLSDRLQQARFISGRQYWNPIIKPLEHLLNLCSWLVVVNALN